MLYKSVLSIIIVMLGINFAYGEPIEYNSYKGVLYGFIIDYPSNWVVEESPYSFSYIRVSFIEPNADDYGAFVLIGVEELEREITMDDYERLILAQQRRSLQNFTLIETIEGTLANNSARVLIYKGNDIDISIKGKIIYTIYDNTVYTIITASKEEEFDKYNEIFDHMINSFKIDWSIIPKPIADIYDEDIKIEFKGWKGLISKIENDTIIRVTPDIRSNTTMTIIITNITSINLFNDQIRALSDNCTLITLNLREVNNATGLEAMQECDDTIGKLYLFTMPDKVIAIDLVSNKEEFNTYLDSFEESVNSIKANLDDITVYLDEYKTLPKRLDAIEIDIPEDWNIFKREYKGHEITYITPNGTNIISNYTGFFIVEPSWNFNSIVEAYNIKECNITKIHYIASEHIAGDRATCIKDGIDVRLQVIDLGNATIGYFNEYNNELDTLLKTFVDKEILFAISNLDSEDLRDGEYKVVLDEREYSIEYSYLNSTINNIEFDKESRSLSIDLSTNALGMLIIRESLLEGPYIISANDKIFNIRDADAIIMVYDYNTSIKIIGSRVIPEFPLVWLLIPLSLSIMIIIRRMISIN